MKTKILGLIAGMALFGPLPAMATTYDFVGNPYTINTNPGPGVLGTDLTGAVTFTPDTSSFTGELNYTYVSSLIVTSGTLSFNLTSFTNSLFSFTDGVITGWQFGTPEIGSLTGPAVGSGGNTGAGGYEKSHVEYYVDGSYLGQQAFVSCSASPANECSSFEEWTQVPSVSSAPLPAALPLFASGLGALGLFGWRRKRKNAAAIAAA